MIYNVESLHFIRYNIYASATYEELPFVMSNRRHKKMINHNYELRNTDRLFNEKALVERNCPDFRSALLRMNNIF